MDKTIEMYRDDYEEMKWCGYESKYEWVCECVFNLSPYDSGIAKKWGKRIIDVCKAILEGRTFEYIEQEGNYEPYLLVCQLLDKNDLIEWGTSIRGAWFNNMEGSIANLIKFVEE